MTTNEKMPPKRPIVLRGGPFCGEACETVVPFIFHPEGFYRMTNETDRQGRVVFQFRHENHKPAAK
jgi:hypothetical protein